MTKQPLSNHFIPSTYHISQAKDGDFSLKIIGKRVGRPSRRLTLHQTGLKILSAKIVQNNKNKFIEYSVDRINHIPTFQEVRIHTEQLQYPGDYTLELVYRGEKAQPHKIDLSIPGTQIRHHLPSIDEPGAKNVLNIEFS